MIGRLVGWLLNDVIVHTLANSKRFQSWAVSIDHAINRNKKVITEQYIKTGEKLVKENMEKVKESKAGVFARTFATEMHKEVTTELNKAKILKK